MPRSSILADIASRGFASWLWFAGVENGVSDTPLERGRLKMSEEEAVTRLAEWARQRAG